MLKILSLKNPQVPPDLQCFFTALASKMKVMLFDLVFLTLRKNVEVVGSVSAASVNGASTQERCGSSNTLSGPALAHHRGDSGIFSLSSSALLDKSFSPLPVTLISDHCDHFNSKCQRPDRPLLPSCLSRMLSAATTLATVKLFSNCMVGGRPRCTPSGKLLESQCSYCRCLWVRGGRGGSRAQQLWLYLLCPAPLPDSSQQGLFFPQQVPCSHIPSGSVVKIPSPWTHSPSHVAFPLSLQTVAASQTVKKLSSQEKRQRIKYRMGNGGKFVNYCPKGYICVLRSKEELCSYRASVQHILQLP